MQFTKFLFVFAGLYCVTNAVAQNPFLPLWEYIPDGEPYVFEDPDNPGKQRLYVYGSHDILQYDFCGEEQVVWSAPVEDLTKWRYDGVIFEVSRGRDGRLLRPHGNGDVLYAPDVTVKTLPNGKKEYYLFPNNQEKGREGMIARSDRPDGPFKVTNWSKNDPTKCNGILRFDPAVFVDDDGRVYGYWGFTKSFGAELDPETMCTLKEGTKVVENMVSSYKEPGIFRFFEASSIRKIKDKYVFIYSRWTADGEFSLPDTNYTLAYAYSNSPLGPFTYGGTIIDARARDTDPNGKVIITASPAGNTHGSICEINGQWYLIYHRSTESKGWSFNRQAMVAPIDVEVKEGKDGYVRIKEAEVTSEGFVLSGLNPLTRYSAAIACWHTGPRPATYGNIPGPYIMPNRAEGLKKFPDIYDLKVNSNDLVHCTAGSVVGYKYYNFDYLKEDKKYNLSLSLTAEEKNFDLEVWVDSPWKEKFGKKIGSLSVAIADENNLKPTDVSIALSDLSNMKGKHALFIKLSSEVKDKSLCTLHSLIMKAE